MPRLTERLILRAPTADDRAALFAIYGDPATNQFNPAGPLPDIEQAIEVLDHWREHWQQHGYGQWAIATREAPKRLIGFGGLTLHPYLDIERLNLGYRFAVSAWGHGYATELSRAALAFGFSELAAPAIFALVRPDHQASISVLEKVGMQRIDTLDDVPGQAASLVYQASSESKRARANDDKSRSLLP